MPSKVETFWNGEPTPCRRVVVKVGTVGKPSYWFNGLEGTERKAVEVTYGGDVFFIDDDDGDGQPVYTDQQRAILNAPPPSMPGVHKGRPVALNVHSVAGEGWLKVTVGGGAPFGDYSHFRSLPTDSVVVRELNEDGSEKDERP